MRRFLYNLSSTILVLLILIIFFGTIYFCLDVFEIIHVPKEYSIASLFYSQIDVIVTKELPKEGQIQDDIIRSINKKQEEQKNQNIINQEPETNTIKTVEENTEVENEATEINYEEILASILENANQTINERNTLNLVEVESELFHYNQLDETGKAIYAKLNNERELLKTGTHTFDFGTQFDDLLHQEDGKDKLKKAYQLAIKAFEFDNPEIFYIDTSKMYLVTEIITRAFNKTYNVSISGNNESYLSDEFPTEEDVEIAIAKVEKSKSSVLIGEEYSDLDKIRNVHDYIVYTTEYDFADETNIYNLYGPLVAGRAVCEGYAKAFKYMLDECGVPCIIARGVGINNTGNAEKHAWNYVKIDNTWYAVDVTWDDPIIIGNIKGNVSNDVRYAYFLKGSENFFKNHFEDGSIIEAGDFVYPIISVNDYKYE